ncbi:MAG: hypothetical protein MI724_14125 [Spirochaetales bacterium]|nr:hypothetical protein [Spirochaetales bacterium]
MKLFVGLLLWDIRFAWRHGFYLIYGAVALLYIAAIRLFPDPDGLATLLVFTDASVLGALFIGAIVLLEKDQGTNAPFSVIPAPFLLYFLAKMLSLFTITLGATVVIVVGGGVGVNNVWTSLFSLTTTTLLFSSLGFTAALRSAGLNGYFCRIIPLLIVGMLPLFDLFPLYEGELFFFLPTALSLELLAFGDAVPNAVEIVVGIVVLSASLAVSGVISLRSEAFFLDWERGE